MFINENFTNGSGISKIHPTFKIRQRRHDTNDDYDNSNSPKAKSETPIHSNLPSSSDSYMHDRSSPKLCKNNIRQKEKLRKPLFEYPAIPEIGLCFVINISALLYAWYCVFNVSQQWALRIADAKSMHHLPFFGWRFKDDINWEWYRWSPFALSYLPYLITHSLIFNVTEKFLPQKISTVLSTSFSIFSSIQMFGVKLVIFTVIQGCFLFYCTLHSRKTLTVWLSSLPSLYLVMNHSSLLSTDIFHVLLFASYTLLSYISFCIDWTRGETRVEDSTTTKLLKRMLFYAFYQPYLFSLIVIYSEFEKQIANRKAFGERPLSTIVWRIVRVAFWWLVIELMLHFFYFESILHDEKFFSKLPKNEFVTMGMAVGAFFHLKYVVIFGLPAAFALIDGMEPPTGPICISRVALYSKIWRGFDRGLYQFFKSYIFLPICAPTFSAWRRILGVLVSYLFVLIWHGFHHQNIVWIALNVVELFLEYGAKGVYSIEGIRLWREKNISDRNFRRLLGWAQIVPFAFGLYSNFYFLGGSRVGWLFVQRIFIEETITLRWPFFLLIFIGYFYMQVTMEFERYYSRTTKCPIEKRTTSKVQ